VPVGVVPALGGLGGGVVAVGVVTGGGSGAGVLTGTGAVTGREACGAGRLCALTRRRLGWVAFVGTRDEATPSRRVVAGAGIGGDVVVTLAWASAR
jgi:hypothetical protein